MRYLAVRRGTAVALAITTWTGIGLASAVPVAAAPSVTITPVVGDLGAPRGIAFDGQGSMYVVESGVAGPGAAGLTRSGRVDKYAWGSTTPAWSTAFNSIYAGEDEGSPPDVLGPAGLSVIGNGCMKHSIGRRNGCQVQMVTGLSEPGVVNETGGAVSDPEAGHVFRLDGATGASTDLADVGTQFYNFTAAHTDLFPDDFPDSNPYAVLVYSDPHSGAIRTFVADAGANLVSEVMPDGTLRHAAYIPNETAPPFRDATPTCIAMGPDGYLYVGTLDLVANAVFPGTGGLSHVYRVNPDASFPTEPQVWASGLDTVTSCTFDAQGNFWATEMFRGGFDANPPGDIVRIPFADPTHLDRFGAGVLAVPGGIAQGPDGAMYVTVGSSAPGRNGAVMKVAVG